MLLLKLTVKYSGVYGSERLNMYGMIIFSKGVMERGGKSWKVTEQTIDHIQVHLSNLLLCDIGHMSPPRE